MMRVLVTLVCLLGLVGCARSVPQMKPGAKFQNSIQVGVGGTRIPLPEGTWEIASTHSRLSFGDSEGEIHWYGVLIKSEGNLLSDVLHIVVPVSTPDKLGYEVQPNCKRTDYHHTKIISYQPSGNQDCYWISHLLAPTSSDTSKYIQDAMWYAKDKGLEVPSTFIQISYSLANKKKFLLAEYHVNPQRDGFKRVARNKWWSNAWHRDLADDAKKAYVGKLIAWADSWHAKVKQGFEGRLAATPTP